MRALKDKGVRLESGRPLLKIYFGTSLIEWRMRQEIEELASVVFDKEELRVIQELILAYCGSDEQHVVALGRLGT